MAQIELAAETISVETSMGTTKGAIKGNTIDRNLSWIF